MDFFLGQIIGFVIGILSSWVFWYFLLLIKPNVQISNIVNYLPEKKAFQIKIINKGKRQVVDVQADLFIAERPMVGNSFKMISLYRFKFKRDSVTALAPIQDLEKPWKLLTATTFTTEPNEDALNLMLSPSQYEKRLVFTLSASDGLSGSKVIQRVAFRAKDIRQGRWAKGLEFIENKIDVQQEQESNNDT
jgi:hypothetical protein